MRSSSSRLNFQRQRSPQQQQRQQSTTEQQNGQHYHQQRLNNDKNETTEKFIAMQILQAILFTTRFVSLSCI